MKLALVGWSGDSGLGRELADAARNLPAECAFILRDGHKPTRTDLVAHVPHTVASGSRRAMATEMEGFLDRHRPDTVLTWETPGSWSFPAMWASRGVRWVVVVHRDWFRPDPAAWRTAVLVSPNEICRREIKDRHGLDSTLLPVPVDAARLEFRERATASRFVSVYGYGGPAERRSLREILAAWRSLAPPPPLVVRAQRWPEEIPSRDGLPAGVTVETGTVGEPSDLFADADVAVQVSRYEGVGTTLMEAQASGAPVITVDAEPMRDAAPFLLVRPERTLRAEIRGRTMETHVPSVRHLAETVSSLAGRDISDLSRRARARAESKSWAALGGRWTDFLSARTGPGGRA